MLKILISKIYFAIKRKNYQKKESLKKFYKITKCKLIELAKVMCLGNGWSFFFIQNKDVYLSELNILYDNFQTQPKLAESALFPFDPVNMGVPLMTHYDKN